MDEHEQLFAFRASFYVLGIAIYKVFGSVKKKVSRPCKRLFQIKYSVSFTDQDT
jgi:hypothetical protein